MKFAVAFKKIFRDSGTIILNDIGLVCIGNREKFYIFILGFFADFWKQVLIMRTSRTIPYAVIINYTYKSESATHTVIYQLPNGKSEELQFYVSGGNQAPPKNVEPGEPETYFSRQQLMGDVFRDILEEKIAVAKTFIGT